jgi:hypothetical protein
MVVPWTFAIFQSESPSWTSYALPPLLDCAATGALASVVAGAGAAAAGAGMVNFWPIWSTPDLLRLLARASCSMVILFDFAIL